MFHPGAWPLDSQRERMPKAVTQPSGWVWTLSILNSNVIGSQYEKTDNGFILIENSLNQIQRLLITLIVSVRHIEKWRLVEQ